MVLFYQFLFVILGVDCAVKLTKYSWWLRVFMLSYLLIETLRLRDSCIVSERKRKDLHGRGPSNINLAVFVCFFDVCRVSLPFHSMV